MFYLIFLAIACWALIVLYIINCLKIKDLKEEKYFAYLECLKNCETLKFYIDSGAIQDNRLRESVLHDINMCESEMNKYKKN